MVRHHHLRNLWLILALVAGPAAAEASHGDPAAGLRIAIDSERGNCAICHRLPVSRVPAFGDVGPPLDGIGARMSVDELRQRIADPHRLNPDTIMPAYRRTDGLTRVMTKYRGRPILSAEELEDVVAYLATLKD
jgi:sulfur-oxidizing protein SoxX